jgi:cytochrome c-type biogenesis protein CcsB
MESENFIFLSLFLSLVFALWGNTGRASSTSLVGIDSISIRNPVENSRAFFNVNYFKDNFCFFLSAILVLVANGVLSIFLMSRWIESGYPPFSNLYESLLFLTWALLFLYFPAIDFTKFLKVLFNFQSTSNFQESGNSAFDFQDRTSQELKTSGGGGPEASVFGFVETASAVESQNLSTPDQTSKSGLSKKVSSLIGMLLVSSSLFIYTFASWLLPSSMREIKPLVPALKSNWLLMHVSIMLLSYSALLAGSLFSILYLAIFYGQNKKLKANEEPSQPLDRVEENSSPLITAGGSMAATAILINLDSLSYRSLGFAFPLLTLGIISGAVWANEAWGSYWSWDPKETWALITWFIYSIYLHLRIQKAWGGEKAAWVGTFGFFVVWICYLGVNLLGKGLHSYGWWN